MDSFTGPSVSPSDSVLSDLGISLATFRQLRALQAREILPEDYDLLMRLHAKPATKVLDDATLGKVSKNFMAGSDFTALPGASCAICLCAMSEGEELTSLKCNSEHTFHSHCIREWMLTASSCCPMDKQDLSQLCLTA